MLFKISVCSWVEGLLKMFMVMIPASSAATRAYGCQNDDKSRSENYSFFLQNLDFSPNNIVDNSLNKFPRIIHLLLRILCILFGFVEAFLEKRLINNSYVKFLFGCSFSDSFQ